MNKRVIAAVAAAALAVLGIAVLLLWAGTATKRAYDGAELVSVVRVTGSVAPGTAAADLKAKTEVVELPNDAVPDDAVKSLKEVAGLATTTTLVSGEVLLKSRMATPGERGAGGIDVPAGLQEIAISLETQRAAAASIKAGDSVGVFGTFSDWTTQLADRVLVTRVNTGADVDGGAVVAALITVAVDQATAQKLILAQETGKVWLSLQNAATSGGQPRTIDQGSLR